MTPEVFQKISGLVPSLGSTSFERKFYHTCRDIFNNDQCNVFVFEVGKSPECILSSASGHEMRMLTKQCANEYISNGHRDDPTLLWARSRGSANLTTAVRTLSPREIGCPVYRKTFYENAAVRQKLAVISRSHARLYYLNLYRNPNQGDYSLEDRRTLEAIGGLLCNLLAKHSDMIAPSEHKMPAASPEMSDEFQAQLFDQVRKALLAEGVGLTPKEAEVCAAISLGRSAAGIGIDLGISINTVATHRKRAYSKLRISSQNELFARYYESVTDQIRRHYHA